MVALDGFDRAVGSVCELQTSLHETEAAIPHGSHNSSRALVEFGYHARLRYQVSCASLWWHSLCR